MNAYCQPDAQGYGDARMVRQILEHIRGNVAVRIIDHSDEVPDRIEWIEAEDIPDEPIRISLTPVNVHRQTQVS